MATWRRCSSCKSEISFQQIHWVCSVSTCNRKRTGLYFCSVACWEAHLPIMRHREAWAVEARAPTAAAWEAEQREEAEAEAQSQLEGGRREPAHSATTRRAPEAPAVRRRVETDIHGGGEDIPQDILIVVSKLKKYIRARSGMNTSDNVMPVLSDYVRRLCDQAIRVAAQDGRKTVLDRDFQALSS